MSQPRLPFRVALLRQARRGTDFEEAWAAAVTGWLRSAPTGHRQKGAAKLESSKDAWRVKYESLRNRA